MKNTDPDALRGAEKGQGRGGGGGGGGCPRISCLYSLDTFCLHPEVLLWIFPSQELHCTERTCDGAGTGFNLSLETLGVAQTLKGGRHCHQLLRRCLSFI